MLSAQDTIVTIGSCFSLALRDCLTDLGCSSGGFEHGLTHTYSIVDFVTWCVTGEEIDRGYRFKRMEGGKIEEWTPVAGRSTYLEAMRAAGAFVLAFGLAEVWQDRTTKAVFWRGVPRDLYEPGRHEFRLTTVEENELNLVRIVELIRLVNESAPIVFMLSPLPSPSTFRDIECIPADCVSKSVLRVAFDRVVSMGLPGVYYWPSFEIVRWSGANLAWRAYGADDGGTFHVTRYLLMKLAESFVDAFYTPDALLELRPRPNRPLLVSPGSLRGRVEYPVRRLVARSKSALRRAEGFRERDREDAVHSSLRRLLAGDRIGRLHKPTGPGLQRDFSD